MTAAMLRGMVAFHCPEVQPPPNVVMRAAVRMQDELAGWETRGRAAERRILKRVGWTARRICKGAQ